MAEFEKIELYELPCERDVYQTHLSGIRAQLRSERTAGVNKPRYFAWRRWVPRELTDSQLEYLAHRMAEESANRCINEDRETRVLARSRARGSRAF